MVVMVLGLLMLSGVSPSEAQDPGTWEMIALDNANRITLRAEIAEPSGFVQGLAFSPDSTLLVWGTRNPADHWEKRVKVWDITAGETNHDLGVASRVMDVEFSLDGSILAVACHMRGVELWDVETGTLVETLTYAIQPNGYAYDLVFRPDGTQLALGGHESSQQGTIWRWEWNVEFPPLPTMTYSYGYVTSIAYSPDSWVVAAGMFDPDGRIQLWNAKSGTVTWTLEGHIGTVTSVNFSPDGTLLVSGGTDGIVRVWDWQHAAVVAEFREHQQAVASVLFSPDGTLIASLGLDGVVYLHDRMSGRAVYNWQAQSAGNGTTSYTRPYRLVFSPDGKLLASTDGLRTIRVWGVPANG
ncbi:MAG: WD40 repeat domain-containing protein [Anaerolineae bacterium]|nr:WD40 repeat domain-containing protein [Anaerolineae bacterium]